MRSPIARFSIIVLTVLVLIAPLPSGAKPAGKVPRLGVLSPGDVPEIVEEYPTLTEEGVKGALSF